MALDRLLAQSGLAVVGHFEPGPQDGLPSAVAHLALIGADGTRMWEVFGKSAEIHDGAPHPLDRWSERVLSAIAHELGATACFPFGGPPWQPFIRWAVRGEGARPSPVTMQVSPSRGLWMSYRGALGFPSVQDLPPTATEAPCIGCPAPCLTACPVGAFSDAGYDVPRCTAHVRSEAGGACRTGCLVRVACPAGTPPPLAQRKFHMDAFLTAHAPAQVQTGN
ncbi:MAG: ferredoxin [Pseudomonadota bacterium]